MSYWVHLEDRTAEPWCSYGTTAEQFVPTYEGEEPCTAPCYPAVAVARHAEGGTYVAGGTEEASISITYNYAPFLKAAWEHAGGAFDGVGDGTMGELLGGKRAGDTIPYLEQAIAWLGTERYSDYWAPTQGNAGHALSILLAWARQHPEAVFRVS